jgi:hypothetical protein
VHRRSIAIAAFSTIVEWYDFTLYLYFSTVLSRVFFGGGGASHRSADRPARRPEMNMSLMRSTCLTHGRGSHR